ncbi:MAG: hypothetical protein V4667_05265 [Bacteroidota bacterium]
MKIKYIGTLLLVSLFLNSYAQKSVPELVQKFYSSINKKKVDDISSLIWAKSDSKEIIDAIKKNEEKFGGQTFLRRVDSTYRTSKSEPKKFYQLEFDSYHEKALIKEKLIIVLENKQYKLAGYIFTVVLGNHDDYFVSYGATKVSEIFAKKIAENNIEKAYSLFEPEMRETYTLESFKTATNQINETIGELKSVVFLDTCSVLNYYGKNESFCYTALQLKGTKKDIVLNTIVSMRSDGTFYITFYQVSENHDLNNNEVINETEKLLNDFYANIDTSKADAFYDLLHPSLQFQKSREMISATIKEMTEFAGQHKQHTIVSKAISRSTVTNESNRYVVVVKNENKKVTLHDAFILRYDSDNKLKIAYFYFIEY